MSCLVMWFDFDFDFDFWFLIWWFDELMIWWFDDFDFDFDFDIDIIRIGKILIQTNWDSGEPALYYLRLPKDIKDYQVYS